MDIAKIKEGFDSIESGLRILAGGPMDYYFRKLTESYDLLLSARFAPFQIGDTVILTKAPKIDRSDHGWQPSKHFLIKGAVGKVTHVEADAKGFGAYVQFDDESWIDSMTGKITPIEPTKRGNFWFHEDYLVRAPCSASIKETK